MLWLNPYRLAFAAVCVGLLLCGCQPVGSGGTDEEKEPQFLIGRSRVNAMNFRGAIEAFQAPRGRLVHELHREPFVEERDIRGLPAVPEGVAVVAPEGGRAALPRRARPERIGRFVVDEAREPEQADADAPGLYAPSPPAPPTPLVPPVLYDVVLDPRPPLAPPKSVCQPPP